VASTIFINDIISSGLFTAAVPPIPKSVPPEKRKPTPVPTVTPVLYRFTYSQQRIPYCCGVDEVGNFSTLLIRTSEVKNKYPYEVARFKATALEAYTEALQYILNASEGRCVQFWFYKPVDYNGSYDKSNYTEDGFRQVVMAHPDAVELAEYVNPNSNNMINGWMIKNKLTMIGQGEDLDDED
jgi:hypothetical protein